VLIEEWKFLAEVADQSLETVDRKVAAGQRRAACRSRFSLRHWETARELFEGRSGKAPIRRDLAAID